MSNKKLSLTIRAVLALGLMGSAQLASAQYVATDLTQNGNPTTILAVSENGTLVGVSSATVTGPSGLSGTTSWFKTGANASSPTTFASAMFSSDFCGTTVYTGSLPGGLPNGAASQVSVDGVNDSGQMIVSAGFGSGSTLVNANGTVRSFGNDRLTAISNTGAVAGVIPQGTGTTGVVGFAAPGASTLTAIAVPTGPGILSVFNSIGGISATRSIVAGSAGYDQFGFDQIFVTGVNGRGLTMLGVGNGIGVLPDNSFNSIVTPGTNLDAWATSVNDSGQVGGGYTVLDRQQMDFSFGFLEDFTHDQAFITSGTSFIDISPDSINDYQTLFLNNAGQAIVQNEDNGEYYLYNGGVDYKLSDIFSGPLNGPIVGFTSSGQIVINDPEILSFDPTIPLTGGTDTTTNVDAMLEAAKPGNAPSSSDSSVPEPGTIGLLGLGMLAIGAGLFGRKHKSAGVAV